jgi:hypothetical protein
MNSDEEVDTKRCTGPCGLELPVTEFHRDATQVTGRKSQCKTCSANRQYARRHGVAVLDEVPTPPIPEGFAVRGISTQMDANGNTEKQWVDARPDGQVFEEIQPALPPKHLLKGVSTLVDERGNVRAQWIKTRIDEIDKYNALLEAMNGLADAWKGKADPVPQASVHNDDLLVVYPMGDPHIGMYSWAAETGNHFDLVIAEQNLVAAVDHLVESAPPARTALIINLGDFFHADNSQNQTMRSHNALDVDTRWGKVLGIGIRAMRRCIDKALEKHEFVRVICEIGNHDDHSALMLAICLQQYYEREPRVEIDTSPAKFHWYRFGKNLLGVTHGDTVKAKDLPGVMACDRAEDWGETKHRFWYVGHVHHDSVKEYPGVMIETFRTLAAGDAWHRAHGYRAGRDMKCDVFHREYGRIRRYIVDICQLFSNDAL